MRTRAEDDRRRQKVQENYNQLFSTYQSFQRLGEQYAVVVAFGLLNWPVRGGRVRRHVLVCDISLSFDAGAGQVYVTGNPNGIQLPAETDMLETADRPRQTELEHLEKEIKDINNDVWDEAFLRHMPKAFVNAQSDYRGQFELSFTNKPADDDMQSKYC